MNLLDQRRKVVVNRFLDNLQRESDLLITAIFNIFKLKLKVKTQVLMGHT